MTIPPDQSPNPITPGQPSQPLEPSVPPGKGQTPNFEEHMQTAPGQKQGGANAPTPMDVTRGPSISSAGVSFDSLLAQTTQAKDSLGTVEKQLKDKNLKLKRPQSHLVKQKLSDANEHIRAGGSKLGMKLPEENIPKNLGPIARFIAMVNDGQNQLGAVQEQLKKMSAKGKQINPADMLSVQVKMGLAQQEIQYTSTLLGKVIQSFTQLMNTQL